MGQEVRDCPGKWLHESSAKSYGDKRLTFRFWGCRIEGGATEPDSSAGVLSPTKHLALHWSVMTGTACVAAWPTSIIVDVLSAALSDQ